MRLHNRMTKPSFWTDPDNCEWPRDKRMFYQGLSSVADDSGCIENRPTALKALIFPYEADSDLTSTVLAGWINDFITEGRLLPYEAKGKPCAFLMNFHEEQRIDNPAPPDVPLPPWIKWEAYPSNPRKGKYIVSGEVLTKFLQGSYVPIQEDLQNGQDDLQSRSNHEHEHEHEPEPMIVAAAAATVADATTEISPGEIPDALQETLTELAESDKPLQTLHKFTEMIYGRARAPTLPKIESAVNLIGSHATLATMLADNAHRIKGDPIDYVSAVWRRSHPPPGGKGVKRGENWQPGSDAEADDGLSTTYRV